MTTIGIFYQGEGLREIEYIEVAPDQNFGVVKTLLIEKHGFDADVLIFLEDTDEPLEELLIVRDYAGVAGVKAHLHRCRRVETAVTYNGETVCHQFGPATTITRVKKWAAEHKFGMNDEETSEHVLQISGTHERPAPGTHLGSLVTCPDCRISFDLLPDQRVNGTYAGETL